ncbi:hypothetical protein, partial [Leptospira interrogans]|uniref:hypothetical protein n=1 Tax=Leptospira interrogans TaxID=173 RepID=UPI001E59D09D
SRVSSWPFLFQERSFKTMVGSSTNKQRFYDQAKKSQATCLGFLRFGERGCVYAKGIPVQRT